MQKTTALLLLATILIPGPGAATAPGDDEAGWVEAMIELRAKVQGKLKDGSVSSAFTGIKRGNEPAMELVADISGYDELWLVAIGEPNYNHGQAVWGDPRLVDRSGEAAPLTALEPIHSRVGWGSLQKNRNFKGEPLRIKGVVFPEGFLAHVDSELAFRLDGAYSTFRAHVGVERSAGSNGHVRFLVGRSSDAALFPARSLKELNLAFPAMAPLTERLGLEWLLGPAPADLEEKILRDLRSSLGAAADMEKPADSTAALGAMAGLHALKKRFLRAERQMKLLDQAAMKRAWKSFASLWPEVYTDRAAEWIEPIVAADREELVKGLGLFDREALRRSETILDLQRKIFLSHPAIDFDRILLVRRSSANLGLPANFHSNSSIAAHGYDNAVVTLSLREPGADIEPVFRPADKAFAGDLCLHFDADRFLFSMPNDEGRWQVFEIALDGSGLRQVTPRMGEGVDNYDACYLPDGDFLFTSTASCVSVPCVKGSAHVANLFRMSTGGDRVRQLCFDQEHNWSPRVMQNGQILYQRWEYTDTPHSNTRLLMCMNPDGTSQREFYGSNSYWPTSFFYARPVPGHATMVAGIATGHHGLARMGELVILDPKLGRREAEGVVQRIPGHGKKVEARVIDRLADWSWPRFLHPFPINEELYLAACQTDSRSGFSLFLVDVFDNMLLLAEEEGYALLEPIPLRKRSTPPVIPDRTDRGRKDALIYLVDIYEGKGLEGIPRGTVNKLRLSSYTYSYHGVGGLYGVIGMDGPWDIRRIMGTVPVEPDGSAFFRVPANTPISLQPLDSEGKAMALMRSWMTAMPGETLSCIGCHEDQNSSPPVRVTMARSKAPAEIESWFGPVRGFGFEREVQPVLDRYCISCHKGDHPESLDFRGGTRITDYSTRVSGNGGDLAGHFSSSYANLFPYVRGPGIESDYHLLTPMEFHADTTELVQLLRKGHHGVKLDDESRDRIFTWIDLNTPYHGAWSSIVGPGITASEDRRADLRRRFASLDENHEIMPPTAPSPGSPVKPESLIDRDQQIPSFPGWPLDRKEAASLQTEDERIIDLGSGAALHLVYIPAGRFLQGSRDGHPDEGPLKPVVIEKPFWISRCEVSNELFSLFDPGHDSKVAIRSNYQFGRRDLPLNAPDQPVVRVSWNQAAAFCEWLSERTGSSFRLPLESEWEWACRAGTDTPFNFGSLDSDFSPHANMADLAVKGFAANTSAGTYTRVELIENPSKYDDFIPKDERCNDGAMISCRVGSYRPNAWGLFDMHGNAAEWTASEYTGGPAGSRGDKVVRGGSWRDRPRRCTSSFRLPYKPYHAVFNVGFRVVLDRDSREAGSK